VHAGGAANGLTSSAEKAEERFAAIRIERSGNGSVIIGAKHGYQVVRSHWAPPPPTHTQRRGGTFTGTIWSVFELYAVRLRDNAATDNDGQSVASRITLKYHVPPRLEQSITGPLDDD